MPYHRRDRLCSYRRLIIPVYIVDLQKIVPGVSKDQHNQPNNKLICRGFYGIDLSLAKCRQYNHSSKLLI